jgi:hypothetical protein
MAYRWNGVECDTFEELQRLQGSARTTSAVVKDTRQTEPTREERLTCPITNQSNDICTCQHCKLAREYM